MGRIESLIDGVVITPLSIIEREQGNIMHAMKMADSGFESFGEAYFTFVNKGFIKGWKKHQQMVLNLIVPIGEVKFVLYDDRKTSPTFKHIKEISISREKYVRLTVPPGIWVSFSGINIDTNLVLNIASIMHNSYEAESLPIENDYIPYQWEI